MDERYAIARYEQAALLLPPRWQRLARQLPDHQKARAEELRLRAGQPMTVLLPEGEVWPSGEQPVPRVAQADLEQLCDMVTGYSRYAVSDTMAQGYLTAPGGFRVGLCGTAVVRQGESRNLRDLSSVCIRIGREQEGLSGEVLPQLWDGDRFCAAVILSPPGLGKTTLLRDMIRALSDGSPEHAARRVAVGGGGDGGQILPHGDLVHGDDLGVGRAQQHGDAQRLGTAVQHVRVARPASAAAGI